MAVAGTLADIFRPQAVLEIDEGFLRFTSEEAQMAQDALLAQSLMAEQRQIIKQPPRNTYKQVTIIKVDRAELVKNYGMVKMDPYCKITIEQSVFETPSCYSASTKPVWNRIIRCPTQSIIRSFLIEVMDENQFYADSRIAFCHVELTEEMMQSQEFHTLTLPLSGEQGEGKEGFLFVQVKVQDVEKLQSEIMAQMELAASVTHPPVSSESSNSTPASGPDTVDDESEVQYVPTLDEIKQLAEMFPTIEEQVIRSVLEATEGDMMNSINSMLSLTAQDDTATAPPQDTSTRIANDGAGEPQPVDL